MHPVSHVVLPLLLMSSLDALESCIRSAFFVLAGHLASPCIVWSELYRPTEHPPSQHHSKRVRRHWFVSRASATPALGFYFRALTMDLHWVGMEEKSQLSGLVGYHQAGWASLRGGAYHPFGKSLTRLMHTNPRNRGNPEVTQRNLQQAISITFRCLP